MKHFKDINYNGVLTYGEMLLQNEYEMSCYNLDEADVGRQRQLYELYHQAGLIILSQLLLVDGGA